MILKPGQDPSWLRGWKPMEAASVPSAPADAPTPPDAASDVPGADAGQACEWVLGLGSGLCGADYVWRCLKCGAGASAAAFQRPDCRRTAAR